MRLQVYEDLFDDATPDRMNTIFRYLDSDEKGVFLGERRPHLDTVPVLEAALIAKL